MKILFTWHAAVVASYQKYVDELAKFKELEITLLIPDAWTEGGKLVKAEKRSDPNYKIITGNILYRDNLDIFFYWLTPYYLLKTKPDIIHLFEEPWSSCAAYFLFFKNLLNIKTKFIFHTFQNINMEYPKSFAKIERRVFYGSDHALACSQEIKEVLNARNYPHPISVVPIGTDSSAYKKMEVTKRKKELRLDAFTIGYIGRMVKEKGIHILLQSVAHLDRPFKLLFLGDGPYKHQLIEISRQLNLADKIVWLSAVDNSSIPQYLSMMDVLVLPSLTTPTWKEQFGRVLVEAMLCETPVIGSNSGEIPHVIGNAGLVFEEGDSTKLQETIQKIIDRPALRKELIHNGSQRALTNYTWQSAAEKTYKIYKEVLQK